MQKQLLVDALVQSRQELSTTYKKYQRQKELLDDLLASMDEIVFVVNAHTLDLFYTNDACLNVYGYTPAEMIADKNIFLNAIHPEDKDKFYENYLELHKKGKCRFEFRIIDKKGDVKNLMATVLLNPSKDAAEKITIRGIAIDITEQKKQMQKIIDQNNKLQEISWIQAHKVRGPVATLLGLAKLIDYNDPGCEENIMILKGITDCAEQLDKIIAQINATTK